MTRRAVIGFPSRMGSLSSVNSKTANSRYPAIGVTDKIRITQPWWSTAGGADWLYLTFSAPVSVQMVSVIGHNLGVAASMRVRLFSTAVYDPSFAQPLVLDTGTMPVWPEGVTPAAGYRWIRPVVLQQPAVCGAVVVDVNTGDGSNAQIEAVDVSGLWDLAGLSPGRQRAFDARSPVTIMAGGADAVPDTWIPRTFEGSIDSMASAVTETTGLDFQFQQDLTNPFVFSPDIDNPASWSRSCMLVRNQKMNPFAGASYRRDKVSLSLIEHQR